ncbi:MAG TPA: alkaline phosphatase family protein [Thermoanaerobaculia bacterium]|nr:alkaline phosphatase family protein [Thermoanaerobaculia bacterium]
MIRLGSLRSIALLAAIFLSACGSKSPPARPRVLFVGLDGADWQQLDRFAADGTMPNLARLLQEGRSGILETEQPPLSPLLWTTMMTGVSPLVHGVLDFTRFNPEMGQREPITSAERRVPAIWNMASDAGRSVAVLGLWATWPAEEVKGRLVSDRLFSFQLREGNPPPGLIWPKDREEGARAARERAEKEIGAEQIAAYLPGLSTQEIETALAAPPGPENRIEGLRRILVQTRLYDGLARETIAETHPDLAILYLQGTDAIGHLFAPFAPPRRPEISESDFALYSDVPRRYFVEIDRLLGTYREIAAKERAILMLASDHGFRWQEGRPAHAGSAEAATAGLWHREEGIYLLAGPGIVPTSERSRGRIDQVASTLLALLGLPPGRGLAGPELPGTPFPKTAPARDPVDYGARFRRTANPAPAEPRAKSNGGEELATLRALGYLGADEPEQAPRAVPAGADPTRTPGSYNNEGLIRRALGAKGDPAETRAAIEAFEKAIGIDPRSASALWNLSDLLKESDPKRSGDLLRRAARAGLPEALPRLLARGKERLALGDCAEARADFGLATELAPNDPIAWGTVALAHLCAGDPGAARRALERSLALDPNQPEVVRALGELR